MVPAPALLNSMPRLVWRVRIADPGFFGGCGSVGKEPLRGNHFLHSTRTADARPYGEPLPPRPALRDGGGIRRQHPRVAERTGNATVTTCDQGTARPPAESRRAACVTASAGRR